MIIDIDNLDIDDCNIIHKIMDKHGVKEFDTKELKCLAEIVEFLNCIEVAV